MSKFKVHSREVVEKDDETGEGVRKVVLETFENTERDKVTEDKEFTRPAIEKALKREQDRLETADEDSDEEALRKETVALWQERLDALNE